MNTEWNERRQTISVPFRVLSSSIHIGHNSFSKINSQATCCQPKLYASTPVSNRTQWSNYHFLSAAPLKASIKSRNCLNKTSHSHFSLFHLALFITLSKLNLNYSTLQMIVTWDSLIPKNHTTSAILHRTTLKYNL